ncbi:hypothetical protein BSK54_14825 [Paenibacillus odorifer]|uniref:hypothetical protein n=1 Tax=Paenibacillus odorifer TaxID=189426 RepID=UPI00096EB816|nr:hypothetical protein [Paenibacillus odorifer]OME01127.1 hypothetical protein BSK54_14825 [Paenibacillus odorifer]
MFLKVISNMIKFFKFVFLTVVKWISVILVISSSVGVMGYFYYTNGLEYTLTDSMKDKIELASWIFAGTIGLVSFLSLFVAFVYENKHIEASRMLRQFYKPYGLTFDTIKTSLNDYRTYISKGFMLSVIHWFLTLTAIISIIVWGISVSAYTENELYLFFSIKKEVLINQGLYLFWFLLCLLLIGIVSFVNLSRLNKNPVMKGYLPAPQKISDINFLVKEDADISEIIFGLSPKIDIYKNQLQDGSFGYEFNLIFPIALNNIRFMWKFFSNDNLLFRSYGSLKHIEGERVLLRDTVFLDDTMHSLLETNSHVELKVYDGKSELQSKILCKKVMENNKISYIVDRQVIDKSNVDLDKGIIRSIGQTNSLNFQDERIIY